MNIIFVIGKLDIGGAELHLLSLCRNISSEQFNIKIFPLKRGGCLEDEFIESGIDILGGNYTSFGKLGVIFSSIALIFNLRKHKFDLIHCFLPEAYVIGGFCSFFKPNIIRVMSRRSLNLYQNKYYFISNIEKFLHKKMDMILGNSKAIINELKEEGVSEEKLGLIYNCINTEKFNINSDKKNINNDIDIEQSNLIFVCVANLIPYKGHEDLLRALDRAKSKISGEWQLLLVGRDDGYGEYLAKITKELGLENNVRFFGEVKSESISDLLKQCDIGLLCSHQEGFSNSILEYMAVGLPVIATNAGGNAEAVIDNETGVIVPISDLDNIGEAILNLSNNENLRIRMGNNAKSRIQDNFTIKKCVDSYEQLYLNLLNKSQVRNPCKIKS